MIRKAVGKAFFAMTGWTLEGGVPPVKKMVLIAAPHTSNWDFPYTIASAFGLELPIHWMGKHTLFEGPKGLLFRALGGIAIDRTKANNIVQAMIDEMNAREEFFLVVPAEGTRKASAYWKSGFYHIARGANVPIALAYLDFGKKRAGIGPLVYPTGDIKADMDKIRAFYAEMSGKFPEKFTPPRLKEEGAVA
ncbi:MAG: lysophospholipid acyltransferase family protein [Polyangiales bacterium]